MIELFKDLNPEIKHFYYLSILNTLLRLITVFFTPIYIYVESGSLYFPLLYMLISTGIISAIWKVLSVVILRYLSVEGVLLLNIVLYLLEAGIILSFPVSLLLVLSLGIIDGIISANYWTAYHVSFTIFGKEREKLTEATFSTLVNTVIYAFGVLVIGFLMKTIGFIKMFVVILTVVLASILYLYKTGRLSKFYKVSIPLKNLFKVKYKVLWYLSGFLYSAFWLLPLYIYTVVKGSLGEYSIYLSISTILGSIFAVLISRYVEIKKHFHVGMIYTTGYIVVFPLYLLAKNIYQVLYIEIVRRLIDPFSVGMLGLVYYTNEKYPGSVLGRDFFIALGRTTVLITILILLPYFSIEHILIIGSIGAFLTSFGFLYAAYQEEKQNN